MEETYLELIKRLDREFLSVENYEIKLDKEKIFEDVITKYREKAMEDGKRLLEDVERKIRQELRTLSEVYRKINEMYEKNRNFIIEKIKNEIRTSLQG